MDLRRFGEPSQLQNHNRLLSVLTTPATIHHSGTSPISYLVLIGSEDVISQPYGELGAPETVHRELSHPKGPNVVREQCVPLPESVGVTVTGTIGVLGAAAQNGLLDSARAVRDLREPAFRASADLYRWLLDKGP